jgi:hypothetical protein
MSELYEIWKNQIGTILEFIHLNIIFQLGVVYFSGSCVNL